jgi:hypothetical protein
MKQFYHSIPLFTLLTAFLLQGVDSATVDLTGKLDPDAVLENPDKGWFHHYYDNGTWAYGEGDFDAFTGLHHFYIRMAWSYFEPQEGQYDWSKLDNLVEKYAHAGYRFSVNVTCKETGAAGSSVPQGSSGYATPGWVHDAGAKGTWVTNWGVQNWEPDWGDPVFMEKLENFHRAFAARYDGKPYMVDIDMGSVGDWGEGHTAVSSGKVTPVSVLKKHIDLFTRVYTKTQVVITDDYFYWGRSDGSAEVKELIRYATEKGVAFRDDSPFFQSTNIRHPEFFRDIWKLRPVTIELDHYKDVRSRGHWSVPDGTSTGADRLRGIVRDAHVTYLGFHGYADTYRSDNPSIVKEMANKAGYWFFPESISYPDTVTAGRRAALSLTVENRGAAPSYYPYTVGIVLEKSGAERFVPLDSIDTREWMPGERTTDNGSCLLPEGAVPDGTYDVHLCIRRESSHDTTAVLVALDNTIKNDRGWYRIGTVVVDGSGETAAD